MAKVTITPNVSKLDELNINVSSETLDQIEKETAEVFAKETTAILMKDFQILQKNAEKLLIELEREERIVRKIFNETIEDMKAQNPKQQASLELSLILAKRQAIYFQNLLLKAYEFIERFRELVTGTQIDYLLYIDEGSNQVIKKVTLEELIPALSIAIGSRGELKLQIARMSALTDLVSTEEEVEENIIKMRALILGIYDYLINIIKTYVNKKGKTVRILPGYAFEAAIRGAADNPDMMLGSFSISTSEYLLDLYKNTIGNKAFYRGGDLKATEVPKEIADWEKEQKEYQLKKIKVAENSLGAQVVTSNTVKKVLRTIIVIISKDFQSPQEITDALKYYIFDADQNITAKIEKEIGEKTAKEITAIVKTMFQKK